jgi:hypothetical protein
LQQHEDFDLESVERSLGELAEQHPNVYRECSLRMLRVLNVALEWVWTSRGPNPELLAIMSVTGHPRLGGKRQVEWAAKFGVSRALISTLARRFCRESGLPPSAYMKSEQASKSSRAAREKYLTRKKKQK